jgi:hypothetical protein
VTKVPLSQPIDYPIPLRFLLHLEIARIDSVTIDDLVHDDGPLRNDGMALPLFPAEPDIVMSRRGSTATCRNRKYWTRSSSIYAQRGRCRWR